MGCQAGVWELRNELQNELAICELDDGLRGLGEGGDETA